jgi:tRNA acetyltransferase TAN1
MLFNLIISTFKHREEQAQHELINILEKFGDLNADTVTTDISGIILARTNIDIFEVVFKLKSTVYSDPWEIQYILRVLPIESVCSTDLKPIILGVKQLAAKISHDDNFRITVEKRHNSLESRQIIEEVAKEIDTGRVNLRRPDWIVLLEIVGQWTGISVIRPWQTFSSTIEKRNRTIL